MPAYKDKNTGKWMARFYYTDFHGITKQKKARGFTKKKDALALVLFVLAMLISFSEFLRRDDLVSKLIALLLFIATLYLVVISIRDIFNKRVR